MFKQQINKNIPLVSIIIFIIIFGITQIMKPAFFYNNDGSIREFGIGYKNKTILPIWLFSILLGILSYISIMYFIAFV